MWEPPGMIDKGPVLRVVGRVSDDPRYGRQVVVSELMASDPVEDDLQDLLVLPAEGSAALVCRLDSLIEGIEDRMLRELLGKLLGPNGELRDRFVTAAAAKYNHHAYPGGLLEHALEVATAVVRLAADHRHIDRDLAIVGALLHDVGKLDAYDHDLIACDLTDAGRLEGEIAMCYYRIRRAIEDIQEFPENRARALLHIILSHHGSLEHGSPVVPCTREAALVHAIDELGSKLGAFDRLERETASGETWSRFDHVIGASALTAALEEPRAVELQCA
jgi:3'-5' exoribonuclease